MNSYENIIHTYYIIERTKTTTTMATTSSVTRRKSARSAVRRVKRNAKHANRKTKHATRKLKYRFSKKKMMMGGGVSTIVSTIKNVDNKDAGVVTLKSDIPKIIGGPKLIVEVDLSGNNSYNGDVLHLVNSLLAQLLGNKERIIKLPDNIAVLDNPNFDKYSKSNIDNYNKNIPRFKELSNSRSVTNGVYDKQGNNVLEKFQSSLDPKKKPTKCTVVIELEKVDQNTKTKINKIGLSLLEAVNFRCVNIEESPYYATVKRYENPCGNVPCWTISEKKEINNPLILSIPVDELIKKFDKTEVIQLLETEEEENQRLKQEAAHKKQTDKENTLNNCGFTALHNKFKPFIELRDKLGDFFIDKEQKEGNFKEEGYDYDAIYTKLVNEYLKQYPNNKEYMDNVLKILFENRKDWRHLRDLSSGCKIEKFSDESNTLSTFDSYSQINNKTDEPATFESVSKKEFDRLFYKYNPKEIAELERLSNMRPNDG